jgi:hypothetical protein
MPDEPVKSAADASVEPEVSQPNVNQVEERLSATDDGGQAFPVYVVQSVRGGKIVHGAYLVTGSGHLDHRSRLARALKALRERLARDLGVDSWEHLSMQQQMLAERAVRKALACQLMEINWDRTGRLPSDYLRFAHSLRRDLEVLGVEKRLKNAKAVTPGEYVGSKYDERNGEESKS